MRRGTRRTAVFFIFIIFVILVSVYYPFSISESLISNILTVSTFLFGIFSAFSISDRHNRVDKIRESDSNERSSMLWLFRASKIHGEAFRKRLVSAIDSYIMSTLDHTIWDYSKTEKEFKDLSDTVASAKTSGQGSASYAYSLEVMDHMENARRQTIALINDTLSRFEWTVLMLLSGVLITSLLLINTGTWISVLLTVVLSMAVAFVFLFLYSLDRLEWKEEARIFEPYQQTFESMGLMRYYPEPLIIQNRARHRGKTYRLGVFPKTYPDLSGKKIKIVKNGGV